MLIVTLVVGVPVILKVMEVIPVSAALKFILLVDSVMFVPAVIGEGMLNCA